MRRSLILAIALGLLGFPMNASAQSTALYYGTDVPEELARAYDRLVVAPEAVLDPRPLERDGATIYGYVSVGQRPSAERSSYPESTVLGVDTAWSTIVMDVRDATYRDELVARVFAPLVDAGYRHFFLDTLDAPVAFLTTRRDRDAHWDAIVTLVETLTARFPGVKLLVNRGFEALDRIATHVEGVVAESLFDRWNARSQRYEPVPESDRRWLVDQLVAVRSRHHLPITVVDYRPPHEREEARATARRIHSLGFGAWVTDAAIGSVGVGVPELVSRRVLLLWDRTHASRPEETALYRYVAPVLEYLGLVPELRELQEPLPAGVLRGRYAGIVAAIDASLPRGFEDFVARQRRDDTPIVLLSEADALPAIAAIAGLGLEASGSSLVGAVRTDALDPRVGFETPAVPHRTIATELHVSGEGAVALVRFEDERGRRMEPLAMTSWGAFAVSPYLFSQLPDGSRRWVVDPFAFFGDALRLPDVPVPDLSTENGSRILVAEVLGARSDAGPTDAWRQLARRVLVGRKVIHTLHDAPGSGNDPALASLPNVRVETGASGSLASPPSFALGAAPSVTEYTPILRVTSTSTTVYAPYADDTAYLETGVPYAYSRVVERFGFGDGPRRLRAIGLRYHADQASTLAGVGALRTVYDWLDTQRTIALYADEFAARALSFARATVLRYPDGSFEIRALGSLRTVRVPASLGFPDSSRFRDIAVVAPERDGTYVSFAPGSRARIGFAPTRGAAPELRRVGAQLERFERTDGRLVLRARGSDDFEIELATNVADACEAPGLVEVGRVSNEADGLLHLAWASSGRGAVAIECQPGPALAMRRTP